eukprot:g17059.t1
MPDLTYTPEVEAAVGHLYEKMSHAIPRIEWPVHAPYIKAINELKKQRGAVILAHNYQTPEIFHGVADIVGDSLQLAKEATNVAEDVIIQCGVHFMAETSKLLNPEKTVLIPDMKAGCSLASSITGADVRALKAAYPEADFTGSTAGIIDWVVDQKQGGIAAAIAEGDTWQAHLADTIAAGAGLVDEAMATLLVKEANVRVEDLLTYGVPFDTDLQGRLTFGREAAHSADRIVHVQGDRAGKAIMAALIETVRQTPSVRVIENHVVEAILTKGREIIGLQARADRGQAEVATTFHTRGVVLTSGGIGGLYSVTTNPIEARGQGVAMAARAGALIADAEFVQFHPTALSVGKDPAPLATEALRGKGATLHHADGSRLMEAERVALNFLTHLSGIATATQSFADAIAHTDAKVTCTRKTLPGLRALQKYAVRKGGGSNHRFGLDDAILIKDNHIAVSGGVVEAMRAANAFAGHLMAIEIEVDTLDQFAKLLELPDAERPDVVMLDNMAPDRLAEGVAMNRQASGKPVILEASGGITLDTIASVAEAGVDYISSGWLTSSAPSLDLGLDIDVS